MLPTKLKLPNNLIFQKATINPGAGWRRDFFIQNIIAADVVTLPAIRL
jgi:hypothetical protein